MSEDITATIQLPRTSTIKGNECIICGQSDPPNANSINAYNICDECKQRLYNLLYRKETR